LWIVPLTPAQTLAPIRGTHRYALVLVLAVIAVLFVVIAPEKDWSRAVDLVLQGGTLFVVIATARETPLVRDSLAFAVVGGLVALATLVALGLVPRWVGSTVAGLAVVTSLVVLVRGIVHLLRDRGVTLQAVAGALAIYLLVGLLFGLGIGVVARLSAGAFYAQGTDGTQSQHVYYSFETMTTTGFGDLSPAMRAGRAIAVFEMLVGQIYLVTVISLLISNLPGRRRNQPENRPESG